MHGRHPAHVGDHLYNFCITAVALRDHVFVALQFDAAQKKAFHEQWATAPMRVACSEIANTAKHSILWEPPKTKGAVSAVTQVAAIHQNGKGELITRIEERPTIMVLLADHSSADVYELTRAVITFWRDYFKEKGLAHSEQTEAEYFGTAADGAEWPRPQPEGDSQ